MAVYQVGSLVNIELAPGQNGMAVVSESFVAEDATTHYAVKFIVGGIREVVSSVYIKPFEELGRRRSNAKPAAAAPPSNSVIPPASFKPTKATTAAAPPRSKPTVAVSSVKKENTPTTMPPVVPTIVAKKRMMLAEHNPTVESTTTPVLVCVKKERVMNSPATVSEVESSKNFKFSESVVTNSSGHPAQQLELLQSKLVDLFQSQARGFVYLADVFALFPSTDSEMNLALLQQLHNENVLFLTTDRVYQV